jgi:flagellar export protein FliJ
VSAQHDRGLHAVSRVRDVRERDSRIGLQHAIREESTLQARVAELDEAVRTHGSFVAGDMNQFVALRRSLEVLREAAGEARQEAETAAVLTASARAHWLRDKTRLSAVEGLLERRADERRAEHRTAETHELDDVAGRLWLRRTMEETA